MTKFEGSHPEISNPSWWPDARHSIALENPLVNSGLSPVLSGDPSELLVGASEKLYAARTRCDFRGDLPDFLRERSARFRGLLSKVHQLRGRVPSGSLDLRRRHPWKDSRSHFRRRWGVVPLVSQWREKDPFSGRRPSRRGASGSRPRTVHDDRHSRRVERAAEHPWEARGHDLGTRSRPRPCMVEAHRRKTEAER